METSEKEFSQINRKLTLIINLLSYQIVAGKTLSEAVTILHRLGLKPSEIAAIYGTTPKSVSVRFAEAKRKKSKLGK